VLLEGAPLSSVATDVGILTAFVVVLCALSMLTFTLALRDAKRTGSLAQY
jgi:hypothetical protein